MVEHPFFVFGRCWSSCYPERTSQRYGLECQKLAVGDVCISLTHKDVTRQAAELSRSAEHTWSTNTQGSKPQTVTHSQRNQLNSRHRGIAQSQSIDIVEVSSSRVNTIGSSESVPQDNRLPRKRRWSAPDQASSEREGVNMASWTKPTNDNQKPSQSSA